MQRFVRVERQWTHSRHWGEKSVTTWSPGASDVDAVADALDDAGALVAEHGRRVAGRVCSGRGVEVGVADAAGDEADEHLAGLRLGQIDLLHLERRAELLQHGGADLHPAARSVASKPIARCVLSQKGFVAERPQRQSATVSPSGSS